MLLMIMINNYADANNINENDDVAMMMLLLMLMLRPLTVTPGAYHPPPDGHFYL